MNSDLTQRLRNQRAIEDGAGIRVRHARLTFDCWDHLWLERQLNDDLEARTGAGAVSGVCHTTPVVGNAWGGPLNYGDVPEKLLTRLRSAQDVAFLRKVKYSTTN